MTDYLKVDSIDNMKFSNRWQDPKKFDAYGRFMNKQGKFVCYSYPGTKYQVRLKKERFYSMGERFCRIVGGVFLNLLTLGICNISKKCRGLFTRQKKVLRFAVKTINRLNEMERRGINEKVDGEGKEKDQESYARDE
jgi:hypothetical protein